MAFTDNFTGTENDPLGGRTGWTRLDGSSGDCAINASNELKNTTTGTGTSYHCTDQGDADHYSQFVQKATGAANKGSFITIRHTDTNNFISVRYYRDASGWQMHKRVTGTYTLLGSYNPGSTSGSEVGYLEGSANSLTVKVDGTTRIGPVTETAHNTVTTQGLVGRSDAVDPWIDDFEASVLSTATNVNATTDTLIITEQAATVNAETSLTATSDTLTLTENAATVTLVPAGTNVLATTDALSITENAADVNLNKSVSATTDALTLSELAASISVGKNVNATSDSLAITEQAATVNAETNVQAIADSISIVEYAATIAAPIPRAVSIDGQGTKVISSNYGSVTLYFNKNNYFTI